MLREPTATRSHLSFLPIIFLPLQNIARLFSLFSSVNNKAEVGADKAKRVGAAYLRFSFHFSSLCADPALATYPPARCNTKNIGLLKKSLCLQAKKNGGYFATGRWRLQNRINTQRKCAQIQRYGKHSIGGRDTPVTQTVSSVWFLRLKFT